MAKRKSSSRVDSVDNRSSTSAEHQAALDEIDRLFHEKARLGIMTTLVGCPDGLGFSELKELCELTDGNLNRHLKVLVESHVLSVKKTGQGRTTHSQYKLTQKGRRAFEKYLLALEQVLMAAKSAADRNQTPNRSSTTIENSTLGSVPPT